jgi:MFS family permease
MVSQGIGAALPIMAAVFLSFMIIGMALPVLPLHVHDVLGFGPFVVGLVAGCQFVASLVSRLWAGRLTDTRGPKHAVTLGLLTAVAGGACYLLSVLLVHLPLLSVGVLLVGRTLLGGAESLIITGGMLWGLALVPVDRAAKVIAWVGMSMFAAMAVGAPLGSFVYASWTFLGIAIVSTVLPLGALMMIVPLRPLVPKPSPKAAMASVLGAVMLPGLGFALSGITFGSITAFLTLYFAIQGWANGALAFTTFAVALIIVRVVAGNLPDRFGGAKVALYCLGFQAAGLVLIALAPSESLAIVGAAVAGAGFSLVFPSLGIEAVRRAPSESRGLAMGTYNAFLDLTLGFGSPGLGFLAGKAGLNAVFLVSAVAAVLAIPIVAILAARKPNRRAERSTPHATERS